MTENHPIIPPPELRRLWAQQAQRLSPHDPVEWMQYVSEKAAQWGADCELEECCDYLVRCAQWEPEDVEELRAARRPKPPSLKQQALAELAEWENICNIAPDSPIRLALEQLPND